MKLSVILVNPQIPPNTGNIARLCGATQTPLHLVHPLGFSTDEKALRRAGLDYWDEVDVKHHDDFDSALAATGEGEVLLFSARADTPYTKARYREGARLVFGAETTGLPKEILDRYPQTTYRIPIWGNVRSLNLSTAVGIAVYEGYRQLGAWDDVYRPVTNLPGQLFVPKSTSIKKHPCADCSNCNWCSDARCASCRGCKKQPAAG